MADEQRHTWEEKVLYAFIADDKIKAIPVALKKRRVILRWLVDKFEPESNYHEKEVNEIISRYHPDSATLRREFILEGFMRRNRDGSAYWRV